MIAVEETSHSQSDTEGSAASPGKHTAAKTPRDEERSDDSTDVEDSETTKQNVVHAGDGDKADGMFTSSILKIYCHSLVDLT